MEAAPGVSNLPDRTGRKEKDTVSMEAAPGVSNLPDRTGSDEDYKYKMDHPEKGLCLVISMENFCSDLELGQRQGTTKDEESVKDVFAEIGFQVQIEKDKNCTEIYEIIEKVAQDDHSKRSCFVCVIMSHGQEGEFYGFDDSFDEKCLFGFFNGEKCKSLAGKPKLFFLQKCNGKRKDWGVTLQMGSEEKGTTIPTEADFLYHYATPPGYVAYRDNGSWFIQSLCKMLKMHWEKKELLHILTLVNHEVAYKYKTNNDCKQIPCIVSKLSKFLYLY